MASPPTSPLIKFALPNVTIGKEISRGCYGIVEEVFCYGMKFAGKRLQEELKPGVYYDRFFQECETLMSLRHPCIVQFIGVVNARIGDSPTIVMEYLPTTLAAAIKQHKSFPEEVTYAIFEDVALGVCFLHGQTPAVIHRDLTVNNVLLDDNMRAKISDLGVAKILDLTQTTKNRTMSRMPGAAVYMPPEAKEENPDYKAEIDIFSFGVLMIHVLYGDCPANMYDYPKDTQSEINAGWLKYIERIEQNHSSLSSLIKECLREPSNRPEAPIVLERVRDEKAKVQTYHGTRMEMIKEKNALKFELNRIKNNHEKDLEIRRLRNQIEGLTKEKEESQAEREGLKMKAQKLESLCNIKSQQINTKDSLLSESAESLKQKEKELELEKKTAEKLQESLDQEESKRQKVVQRIEHRRELAEQERDQAWQQLSNGDQFHLLHTQCILKWETVQQRSSISMTASQYTIIGSKLYFGGGHTDTDKQAERKQVFELDISASISDNPIKRVNPDCPLAHFGLGNIGGKLVTVGGKTIDDKSLSKKVYVYGSNLDGTSGWSDDTIPCLSVPRARACVISQTEDESSTCIAACGGRVFDESLSMEISTDIVEVYRSESPQWVTVTSLPEPRAALRATVLHNTVYLMGGYDHDMIKPSERDCWRIVKDKLLGENSRISWNSFRDLPSRNAAPGHLCGTLLAIGGFLEFGENKKPLLAFNPNIQDWVHVGNLPKTISSATAATLPNGKLIIFGGWEKGDVRNKDIFIAQVTGRMF